MPCDRFARPVECTLFPMALEFALRSPMFGKCWSASGSAALWVRLGAADGFLFAPPPRVTLPGKRLFKVVVHVADSDSDAQVPAKPLRKGNLSGTLQTKTETQLLKDLQDYIVSRGLPPYEVPTTSELASHGRQGLANRVRRRGYKQMALLLQQVRIADTGAKSQSGNLSRPGYGMVTSNVNQTVQNTSTAEAVSNDVRGKDDVGRLSGEDFGGDFGEISLSGYAPKRAAANGHFMYNEEAVRNDTRDQLASQPDFGDDHSELENNEDEEVSTKFSEEQDTDPEISFKDSCDLSNGSPPRLCTRGEDNGNESGNAEYETENLEDSDPDVGEAEDDMKIPDRSNFKSTSREVASQKAALLKAKLLQYFDGRNLDFKQENSLTNFEAEIYGALKDARAQIFQSESAPQLSQEFDLKNKLEQLKSLLRSRESKLAEVSRQVEEAKVMLSLARAKATAELLYVEQLAAGQDVRLNAAKQATSQMKKVHLEWWGEAGQVQLSGSFNGWQHHLSLEPDPSSEIPKPDGSRGPMMWGTYLCLYCGVFEIKFIVDGKWQVDHRREVVFRDTFQNNVLRVD